LNSVKILPTYDVAIIKSLADEIWPKVYSTMISAEQIEYMLNWMYSIETLQENIDHGHQFYLYNENEVALGFMCIQPNFAPNEMKLNKLYVQADCHRKGIGRALIERAKSIAKEKQQTSIVLRVNKGNPAVDFYKNLGFEITKLEVLDIGGGFVMDDYIMSLPI
jgi:ribosomal protein S18 acetylase RimI-like enzyme